MPTYLEVQQRVSIECLNRFDLGYEVKRAIVQTIRRYETERFWFNETSTALTAVVSQEWVTLPANFLVMDWIGVTQNNATTELTPLSLEEIRQMNVDTSVGLPTRYVHYGNRIRMANVPDSAYSLPIYYIKQLPALSADSDTNDWLSAAEDCVVFGAASLVSANHLHNLSAAAAFAQLQQFYYNERLLKLRDQEIFTHIRPTKF